MLRKQNHSTCGDMHSWKPAGPDLARLHVELDTSDSNNFFNLSSHFHPPMSLKHLPAITTSLKSNYNEILWKNNERGILTENNRFQQIKKATKKWLHCLKGFVLMQGELPGHTMLTNKQEMQYFIAGRSYNMYVRWAKLWDGRNLYTVAVMLGTFQVDLERSKVWGDHDVTMNPSRF